MKKIIISISIGICLYGILYAYRLFRINAAHRYEYVEMKDLPQPCARYIDSLCRELAPAGTDVVRVQYCDLDGDGDDEWITDAGPGRGASQSWYAVWKKMPSGEIRSLGTYYCDESMFFPHWHIWGMPSLCCWYDSETEWIPWKNEKYEGKGVSLNRVCR